MFESTVTVPLRAQQRECAVVSLRGDPTLASFRNVVDESLGLSLPAPGSVTSRSADRLLWVGPDTWFWIGPPASGQSTVERLMSVANEAHIHCAVTDVSGGYAQITLSGPQAIDIIASGCPLDLHPAIFGPGAVASSLFYQAGIHLWKMDEQAQFELLVRSSFADYFWKILAASCAECGLERSDSAEFI
ncbi:MAG: sarcosine oxidase subunit gamma family protein [Burkholderiaceae bacterium]